MSESHLPDDLSTWPTDPYRLLGVERGADSRNIRRAYHALIRRFKPEHAPEAFRRIREAFEATQRYGADFFVADEPDAPDPTGPPVEFAFQVEPPPPPVDLWAQACAGEVEAAYRGLMERLERGSHAEETFLQLYWLLLTTPALDPDQTPMTWLVRGLRACGPGAGRLRGLWSRQAEVDREGALGPASASLLDAGTPVDLAAFVAEGRWRTARRSGRWEVIVRDVATLRDWLPAAAVETWVRLLLLAAENVAWAPGPTRDDRDAYREGAERTARDHALDIDDELTRFEYADAVTAGLSQRGWAGIGDDSLAGLLRRFWDDRGPHLRPALLAFTAGLAQAPSATLTRLDTIYKVSPPVLGLFWELLGEHGDGWPDEPTAFATLGYLTTARWGDYPKFRFKLLEFCLRERISPLVVAQTLEGRTGYILPGNLSLALAISTDWPLLATYRACEVGWG